MKIEIEDVRFSLSMKIGNRWLTLPMLNREDYDGEGSLQLIFSGFCGPTIKEFRLNACDDTQSSVGVTIEFPDVGSYDGYDDDERHQEFNGVILTAAQVEQLIADLEAKAEAGFNEKEIHVEYRPVNDGANVRHCVIVQYHYSANDYLTRGVEADFWIRSAGGIVEDDYPCAGIVTVNGRFGTRESADQFIARMGIINRDLQHEIRKLEAEDEALEAAEPATV